MFTAAAFSRQYQAEWGGCVVSGHRTNTNIQDNFVELPLARSIETRAGALDIAILGSGSGQDLIMLSHGLENWSSLVDIAMGLVRAEPTLRVIAFSRPGCGSSPPIAETDRDPLYYEASVVLPALMDALDIACASFVGHADGASVALIFASLFPDRVLSVTGLASYGFADDYLRASLEAIPFRHSGPELLLKSSADQPDPNFAYQRWRQNRLSECQNGWDATACFDRISAPVLLIHGLCDEFISVGQTAAVADSIPGQVSWVSLRNCGHWIHRESPEQIVLLVQGQLRRCSGKASSVRPRAATQERRLACREAVSRVPTRSQQEQPRSETRAKIFCFD
jgi:pimeloyl-ACP methyl ester carboxylesterase